MNVFAAINFSRDRRDGHFSLKQKLVSNGRKAILKLQQQPLKGIALFGNGQ
jgi:hypothetical protein